MTPEQIDQQDQAAALRLQKLIKSAKATDSLRIGLEDAYGNLSYSDHMRSLADDIQQIIGRAFP
jgi:hypothetical protein